MNKPQTQRISVSSPCWVKIGKLLTSRIGEWWDKCAWCRLPFSPHKMYGINEPYITPRNTGLDAGGRGAEGKGDNGTARAVQRRLIAGCAAICPCSTTTSPLCTTREMKPYSFSLFLHSHNYGMMQKCDPFVVDEHSLLLMNNQHSI